jgi:hypothetical protein
MKSTIAVLLFALLPFGGSHASALAPDQSDIWWSPAESGWGVQLAHRGQVIFATVYLYDAQGKPTWITAALRPAGAAWTGDVLATTGPWFGAPGFDPNTVTRRVVGSMTWQSDTGTLSYSVDGVSVTKKLVRQPLDNDNYAGSYMGALSWANSCTGTHENYVEIVVTQVGQNVTLNWQNEATRDTCSMSGQLGLDGQFGSMSGQFQCGPVHDDGQFNVYGLRVTPEAITGSYESSDPDSGCSSTGYLSAVRRR